MEGKVDFKCVIVGHVNTGKTCLFTRICNGTFDPNTQSTLSFCGVKSIPISIEEQEEPVIMSLWDTIGSDRFLAPTRQFTRNSNAAIICCSLNDTDFELDKAKFWTHIFLKDTPSCKIYLTGTKCDLPKLGSIEQKLKEYANLYCARYIETSAKDGTNVADLLKKIAHDWVLSEASKQNPTPSESFTLEEPRNTSNSNCC